MTTWSGNIGKPSKAVIIKHFIHKKKKVKKYKNYVGKMSSTDKEKGKLLSKKQGGVGGSKI